MTEDHDSVSADLARVLESLSSEGELNSSGVFTIDVRKALPKLEKFQLPKPHFGLLKIIQSAVASGARQVWAEFGATTIRIEHNGNPPDEHGIRHLLSYLMAKDQPTEERALRDLAIGVNTTLARGASWVEVSAKAEEGWVSQRWMSREESSQKEHEKDLSDKATVRFVMRRTAGQTASQMWTKANRDIFALMGGKRDAMDEDARAVYDRCRNSPIKVTINGRRVPPSTFGKRVLKRWSPFTVKEHRRRNLVEIYIQALQPSPHLLSVPEDTLARHRFYVEGEFDGALCSSLGRVQPLKAMSLPPQHTVAMIGIRSEPTVPGEMVLVKDGVDLTRLAPRRLPKGVSAVLAAEGLPLDLSQFRIRRGPETGERLGWLHNTIVDCMSEILAGNYVTNLGENEMEHLHSLANLPLYQPS